MLRLVRTLELMAGIYRLSREGGPKSPRFQAYLEVVPTVFGLAAYNPMSGPHALETVEQLLAIDAEGVAEKAGTETLARCGRELDLTLALVLCAPGMWTDRLATEVAHRTVTRLPAGHGLILHWTREEPTIPLIHREAVAETIRVIWGLIHGAPGTVSAVLQREGLAYAVAGNPFPPLDQPRLDFVSEVVEILGESTEAGDMAATLYGDPAAERMGWTRHGVAEFGGFQWGIARAERLVARHGLAGALRVPVSSSSSSK